MYWDSCEPWLQWQILLLFNIKCFHLLSYMVIQMYILGKHFGYIGIDVESTVKTKKSWSSSFAFKLLHQFLLYKFHCKCSCGVNKWPCYNWHNGHPHVLCKKDKIRQCTIMLYWSTNNGVRGFQYMPHIQATSSVCAAGTSYEGSWTTLVWKDHCSACEGFGLTWRRIGHMIKPALSHLIAAPSGKGAHGCIPLLFP